MLPSNKGAIPPQPGEVLREGQGVVPQSAPRGPQTIIFVEYKWHLQAAVRIVVLLVNYLKFSRLNFYL